MSPTSICRSRSADRRFVATIGAVRTLSTAAGLIALALCAGCGGGIPSAPTEHGLGGGAPSGLIPTPIGDGPEFQPAARLPTSGCVPGALAGRYRAHIEVFGRGQAVVIPAGIGVGADARHQYGRVIGAGCRADARTLDPTGVVHFDRDDLRLGDVFAVWGRPLDGERLLSFRGAVSAFVGGRRVTGDPARIALRDGMQIVLESGGYIPPHPSFRFPPRSTG
jgi:hypothetical protein